jgi:hypothetical protein
LPTTAYTLDFYSDSSTAPGNTLQGNGYLGSTVVTTDIMGVATFNVSFETDAPAISATATGPTGTSEVAPVFPFATVALTYFDWNKDRNGTVANAGHRGVDFTYTVSGSIPTSVKVALAFYWASGITFNDIIAPAYEYGATTPDTISINPTDGDHGHSTDEPFAAGNDPARWGAAPPAATYIMAVIDPDNVLGESDYSNRIQTRALPTSQSDVLQSSVHYRLDQGNTRIEFDFQPGYSTGTEMPLSEAEVYLGVDHFNWIQFIRAVPSNIASVIALLNFDVTKSVHGGITFDGVNLHYNADSSAIPAPHAAHT